MTEPSTPLVSGQADAGINVLHVDDDPSVLDLTESFLTMELNGVEITTATGSDDALARLAEETFHCIISDYEMPGRDGLDLLAEVRNQYPNLPFMLYTGKGSEEIAAEAINAGVTGYLQKGGSDQIRRLANRVNHAAGKYRIQLESERFSTVLQALDYPTYVVNNDAEFEYVNSAMVELTGYSRKRIIGSSPRLIKSKEDVVTANRMLAEIVSSSGPDRRKFRVDIQRADGDIVPCYDHMAALPFDDEFRGSVGILREATTEVQQREELLQQNERLEEFASVVSHELSNPLQVAAGRLELAQAECKSTHLDDIADALERSQALIDDLLTLARSGDTVENTEAVSISAQAKKCWQTIPSDEASLVVDSDQTVSADRSHFRQLIKNIFINAVKHGGVDATVSVGTLPEGFYIADDGVGIPESKREDIFEIGYSTAESGTGFGLRIVKQIVNSHNWKVTVTESNDGGARFEITGINTVG